MSELKLKVSDIRELTPDIKAFVLEAAESGDLPRWEAGAHIDFLLENGLRRSYSLANDPSEPGAYRTAILREANGGGGSKWMHDNVSLGDILTTTAPANNFPLSPDAKKHMLLAGGIGITPLLAMGYALKASGADYVLHYCSKSAEQTAFMDEVKAVFDGRVHFHHDGGDPSKGIKLDEVLADPEDGTHLYICGPGGLINAARAAAGHWPSGTVHFELFSSARTDDQKQEIADREDGSFEVELAKRGVTLTILADQSIFEVLFDNGVMVPSACEEGWCGNCAVGLIEGEVDHRDECLSEEERETTMQVCVSRAAPGVKKLVLDL